MVAQCTDYDSAFTSCARQTRPSLPKIALSWDSTVRRERDRRWAICSFRNPSATSSATRLRWVIAGRELRWRAGGNDCDHPSQRTSKRNKAAGARRSRSSWNRWSRSFRHSPSAAAIVAIHWDHCDEHEPRSTNPQATPAPLNDRQIHAPNGRTGADPPASRTRRCHERQPKRWGVPHDCSACSNAKALQRSCSNARSRCRPASIAG